MSFSRGYHVPISAFLIGSLWLQRTGGAGDPVRGLLVSILAMLAMCGLGWIVGSRLTTDPDRRAVIALIVGAWTVLFGSWQVALGAVPGDLLDGTATALLSWALLLLLAVRGVARARVSFSAVSRALTVAGALLLLTMLPQLAPIARPPEAPAPAMPWSDARRSERPDIYLVVLDKYTSGAWLAATYGLDHRATEDSLRALGFVVPRASRTNYAHTKLVLTSMLQGRLLSSDSLGSGRAAYDNLTEQIGQAPLWSELTGHGYRLAFFPSQFDATRTLPGADLILEPPRTPPLLWGQTFVLNSPITALAPLRCWLVPCEPALASPYPIEPLRDVQWKLDALAALPDSGGPIAAFLHLLVPHEPYLFADDCSERSPWWPLTDLPPTDSDSLRAAYATQVRCLDRRLLATVRTLIKRSSTPPVIILTGDHGNGLLARDVLRGFTLELDELSDEQLGERFGVFTAVLFPGASTLVGDEFTLVNLLPTLRHVLFAEPLQLQPDSSFWSSYQNALELTALDPTRLRAPSRQ